VNPNGCIEDYIDPQADLIAYERMSAIDEIMAGGMLVRNTESSWEFFEKWVAHYIIGTRTNLSAGQECIAFKPTLVPTLLFPGRL
jgi:hypothetical protein